MLLLEMLVKADARTTTVKATTRVTVVMARFH